jgi:hypothetical protein
MLTSLSGKPSPTLVQMGGSNSKTAAGVFVNLSRPLRCAHLSRPGLTRIGHQFVAWRACNHRCRWSTSRGGHWRAKSGGRRGEGRTRRTLMGKWRWRCW